MFLTCMRVFVVTVLLATLVLAEEAWTECKVSSGSVSFPAAPKYKLMTDPSPVGTLTTHNWEYRASDVSLTANTVKLPPVALTFADAESIYEDAAKALVEDAHGKQLSYEKLTISGHPAAQVTYSTGNGQNGRARFVLVEDVLLTAVATWPGGSQPDSVEHFFSSLATK